MIKKTFLASMLVMLSVVVFAQPKAKYVFYFIGDGMGVNQVYATETYLGALKGVIGVEPICFASFPNAARQPAARRLQPATKQKTVL